MKTIAKLAIGLALGATAAGSLRAQQVIHAQQSMPGMPGMDMPQPPSSPQRPKPDQTQRKPAGERKAAQPRAGQLSKQPDDRNAQQSIEVPVQTMQEPEALDFRTGGDMPAPELLGDVVKREPMTLKQFLLFADASNPTLGEAQRNVERSQQQARQAGLPPNPTVGYNGDHIRGGSYHSGEEGAFFTQEFVLGHKLALRRDLYRAEGESNGRALEVQRARVHNDVAQAFFDALAAQQSVALHDRLLKVALDSDTNTHELARVGQVDAAGILTAEVATEQARIAFVEAQRLFLAHFAELATLAGQHALEAHPLQGALVEPPAFDPEMYVRRDVEESPLVRRAQAETALGDARLKDARRERAPNLEVTAGEWYSGEQLGNGRKAGWESFAQAGVELPLWNRNQGNIAAAKALLDRAHREEERTKLWTRNQTEPLAQQYLAARFTAERYRTEMLPRARRAYELQVSKYQQMSLEYPAVLAAQQMLFTLQLGYTEALHAQWRAAIALQNYGLMNALDEPLSSGTDSTTINLPTSPREGP